MSASCRTRWRRAWSAVWRSIASARTLAAACRKGTSLGVKRCASVAWMSSTPKGWSLPSIITARLLAAPNDAQHRRHREAALAGPVGDDRVGAGVEGGAGVGVERSRDAAPGADHLVLQPGVEVEAAAVAAELPDAGAVDPVDFADQRSRHPHQRLRIAVLQRPLAQLRDDGLLRERPLQLVGGPFALGDVVEDAVPDRHSLLVGLEHGLVEHPDHLAGAGVHPVLHRPGVAVAEKVLVFDLQRPGPIVGMQEPRPETGVALELLRAVAEDLLDLRADVAPLAVLTQLGGVDDDRQPLDQSPVVLPARR